MKTEKRVTFDDGTEVLVDKEGNAEVIEPDPIREFYDALRERTEVEQPYGYGEDTAFIGDPGFEIKSDTMPDIFDLAEEHGVEIIRFWPAYSNGDPSDLPLYIRVVEA